MIWFEGMVRADGAVPFDLRDRGLTLADGLFETLLCLGGAPYRLDDHLARMDAGAAALKMALDRSTIETAIGALAASMSAPCAIRVTATRGRGPRGLRIPAFGMPTVFASAAPWSPQTAFRDQRLATSAIRRNASSPLSRIKSLSYLDNVLALDAAVAAGADDALLSSTAGGLACTSAGNLFVIRGLELATPPVSDGVLPGIVRGRLLSIAAARGFEPAERPIAPGEVFDADAVFSTNSLRLVSPVVAIDGRPVGRDPRRSIDPLKVLLARDIAAECGVDPRLDAVGDP